jgi:c-di-GMP-binding flagellar brake protein YcgR
MVNVMENVARASNDAAGSGADSSLPVWLLDKNERVSAGCMLVDISDGGAAVLVPRNQPAPSDEFDLVVMSPDGKDGILTILQAEKRWVDTKYSGTHKKMGMEFVNVNPLKSQVINSLINMIESKQRTSLGCNIVNYKLPAF